MSIIINGDKIPDLPLNGTHFENLAVLTPADLVLRAHLMIEQLLDYFISKVTGYEGLYTDARLSFHQKTVVAKNLGLRTELLSFIKRFNQLRNKFAHSLDYELSDTDITELASLHNNCFSSAKTNISDASLMQGSVQFELNGEVINRNMSVLYKEATSPLKLMNIVTMFIGTKFLSYIRLVYNDSLEMDKESLNRINIFRDRQLSYHAKGGPPPPTRAT